MPPRCQATRGAARCLSRLPPPGPSLRCWLASAPGAGHTEHAAPAGGPCGGRGDWKEGSRRALPAGGISPEVSLALVNTALQVWGLNSGSLTSGGLTMSDGGAPWGPPSRGRPWGMAGG